MQTSEMMRLSDLFGLLIGRREAIVRIARAPQAIWIGCLLVASAAMAREYDRHWLIADWWHLLLPFVASFAIAVMQFLLFWLHRDRSTTDVGYCRAFRAFLACFWMTAPLAWAYAIPYERFLSPPDAVAANLWTLAAVSIWRGLIICRVLQIVAQVPYWKALLVSMGLVQIIIAGVAVHFLPQLLDVMSGIIERTPEDRVLRNAAGALVMETIYVGWLILPASLIVYYSTRSRFSQDIVSPPTVVARGLWVLPIIIIAGLAACLPWTQPPWNKAYHADHLLSSGDIPAALSWMNQHPRSAFPIDWRPHPGTGYPELMHDLTDILPHLRTIPQNAWPREYYLSELERLHFKSDYVMVTNDFMDAVEILMRDLPEGQALRIKYAEKLEEIYKRQYYSPTTTPAQ